MFSGWDGRLPEQASDQVGARGGSHSLVTIDPGFKGHRIGGSIIQRRIQAGTTPSGSFPKPPDSDTSDSRSTAGTAFCPSSFSSLVVITTASTWSKRQADSLFKSNWAVRYDGGGMNVWNLTHFGMADEMFLQEVENVVKGWP